MKDIASSTGETITVNDTGNGSDTYYYQSGDYSVQVFAFDANGNRIGWIDYQTILNDTATYADYKFTVWQITLNKNIAGPGTITWSYESTGTTEGVSKSHTYANTLYVGSTYDPASYTWRESVYKTDGDGNASTTSKTTTSSDGTVTWKVYVDISDLDGTSGDLVITDTLPAEVTLSSVKVQIGYSTQTMEVNGSDLSTVTFNNTNVTGELTTGANSPTVVTVNIPNNAYIDSIDRNNGYIVLTYTTTIDGWGTEQADVTYELKNSVYVELNSVKYGEDTQEQDITHTYVDQGTTTTYDHDPVEKNVDSSGMNASDGDNILDYYVAVNLDEETLNNGEPLTFTDLLMTYEEYNQQLYANLIYNSVAFYKLYKVTVTDLGGGEYTYTYVDDDNNTVTLYTGSDFTSWSGYSSSIYPFTESDKSITYYYKVKMNIDWDYSEYFASQWSNDYYHELTAEVPDETAILVEYSYYITYENNWSSSYDGQGIYLVNTATLTGEQNIPVDSDSDGTYTYYEPKITGTISNAGGLTIVKSGAHTSTSIPGAVFALYWYDSTAGEWKPATEDGKDTGTAVTFTTGSGGTITINPVTDRDNSGNATAYEAWYKPNTLYYIVETYVPGDYLLDSETKHYFYWYDDSSTASLTYDSMSSRYPYDWDSSTEVSRITTATGSSFYIYNTPITSFELTKVSNTDGGTISGATFALYSYEGVNTSGDEIWKKIGTYKTDSNGVIKITYDESVFTTNKAYKLTEVTAADGYNIGWEDNTEFYFWWSADSGDDHDRPSTWATTTGTTDGLTYATAIDLSSGSASVTATNTETSTTIEVTKVWIGTDGEEITNTSGYSAEVQLYYYLTDDQGNVYTVTNGEAAQTSTTSTATELVTLTTSTGVVADTTATLYSFTTTRSLYNNTVVGGITYNVSEWNSVSNYSTTFRDNVIAAMFDEDYEDSYIEVVINNAVSTSDMQLVFQSKIGNNYGDVVFYVPNSGSVSDSPSTGYNTVTFSLSELKEKFVSAGYDTADEISAIWNDLFLSFGNSTPEDATMVSFEIVTPASLIATSGTISKTMVSSTWTGNWYSNYFSGSIDTIAEALQQDGALICVTYTATSDGGTLQIGLQSEYIDGGSTIYPQKYIQLTDISAGSGTISVSVDDLTLENNGAYFSYDDLNCIWLNGCIDAEITEIKVVVPATGTTSKQTYVYTETSDYSTAIAQYGWPTFLTREEYNWDASDVISALETEGAVIYIGYTCTSVPTSTQVGIQYTTDYSSPDWYNVTSQIKVGSGYISVDASKLLNGSTYDLNDYNAIIVTTNSADCITITSVSILTPYTVTESISGVIASDASYAVTLYHPYLVGVTEDGGQTYSGNGDGTITISHSGQTNNTWNAISNAGSEPTYNYSGTNNTETNTDFTGYAFFDAIYSDLDSNVVITLTGVDTADEVSVLNNISLLIQGDKSFNEYGTLASVSPTVSSGTDSSGNTVYYLTYSSADIRQQLANNSYTNAAAVFADYNALVLAISGSQFSATVTDLKVVTTAELVAEDTFLKSSLIGVSTGAGVPYTDGTGTSYVYTLNSSNNFTVAVANLPLTLDVTYNGKTVTLNRNYYFLETSYSGGTTAFTTTYSQTEGENGGGEIVISNLATSYVLPETGISIDYTRMYEFGVMLILLSLFGAGAYRNISRQKKSLVEEPTRERVPRPDHESVPDVRTRKFEIPRIVRKGDTRAGPDEAG
ncbi:MAG: hypothetical protein LUC38_00620 [Oscillospiraceae bacterium]|nr:hypothetical protein [Oscillospiraceae bacterium]